MPEGRDARNSTSQFHFITDLPIRSLLVRLIACSLPGAALLSELALECCYLDPYKQHQPFYFGRNVLSDE